MRKVITYGTFDLFHQGHYNILKRAKEEGDYLIVGVTGERYDAESGKLSVQDSLATRIENVKKTGFADKIIVEEYLGQKIPDIQKYDIDVLVIGSDWKGKFDHLSKYCEVKYLERTKNISSTQLRQETLKIYRLGIATDDMCDNEAVLESKSVSGIHAECVYAKDEDLANRFCDEYELDGGFSDYDEFLENADIIYIKTGIETRAELAMKALEKGKSVICDTPVSFSQDEEQKIIGYARNNNLLFLHSVTTNYLQAFGQLQWMARGNLIGDLVSLKARISRELFEDREVMSFEDVAYYPLSTIVKIMGTDYDDSDCKIIRNEDGKISYAQFNIKYPNAIATADISMDLEIDNEMEILGSEGIIRVPEDWWRIGYFKVSHKNGKVERYSSNLEGNGFRYMIQALQLQLKNGKPNTEASQDINEREAWAILDILSKVQK